MKILNQLTLKELKMNKQRTIVTLIGVILSCALMVGIGLIFSSSQKNMVDSIVIYSGDYHVRFDQVKIEDLSLIENNIKVKEYAYTSDISFALGEKYDKPKEMTDHGGTIHTYVDLFHRTDFFCSNTLENMNAYFWLKNCREIVNYKDSVFHDPETIDIWDDIIEDITKFGIKKTLTYLVDEKDKYCFLPEYAVLAIPLNRILIVAQEVKNELSEQLQDSQKDWIKSILKDNLDSEYINKLLLSSN